MLIVLNMGLVFREGITCRVYLYKKPPFSKDENDEAEGFGHAFGACMMFVMVRLADSGLAALHCLLEPFSASCISFFFVDTVNHTTRIA